MNQETAEQRRRAGALRLAERMHAAAIRELETIPAAQRLDSDALFLRIQTFEAIGALRGLDRLERRKGR